jgi:hypothetical protein
VRSIVPGAVVARDAVGLEELGEACVQGVLQDARELRLAHFPAPFAALTLAARVVWCIGR